METQIPIPIEDDIPSPENRFANEQIVRNALLCETDLREWFCSNADKQTASVAWKGGMKRLIMSAFDNSKVLSWLDSGRVGGLSTTESILQFRILINLFNASIKASDRKNPSLITFTEAILWNYRHYVSRASGMKEREMQGRVTIDQKTENVSTVRNINVEPPEKKHGLGGIFKGAFGR